MSTLAAVLAEVLPAVLESVWYVLELIWHAVGAWRYMFSARTRAATHARWQQQSQMRTVAEVMGGALVVLATLVALVWLATRIF